MQTFYSPGKLLLSGEYVVLDGASALALPTRYGQSLKVKKIEERVLQWKSLDHQNQIWFQQDYPIEKILQKQDFRDCTSEHESVQKRLFLILQAAAEMNPELLLKGHGFELTTLSNFPRDWGLGSSSTLIANISKLFSVNAYELLNKSFGGSGYDVAVALNEEPVVYQLLESGPSALNVTFDPPFTDSLFFIHLNQKQNSRSSINHYRSQTKASLSIALEKISSITHHMKDCSHLREFELLIEVHENIISKLINLPKIKSQLFPDYKGAVKSLGGWGGDFVLATGNESDMEYFRKKGFDTIVPFRKMILQN